MADFKAKTFELSDINGGKRYENGQVLSAETINKVVEAAAYALGKVENVYNKTQVNDLIASSHVVNITDLSERYTPSNLPTGTASDNGKTILVDDSDGLYAYSYDSSESKWTKKYEIKSHTLYLNLADGCLYRYTMSTTTPYPNFIKMTISPATIEQDFADVASSIDDVASSIDTKIAALVDSAPDELNTLKELAEALKNDANVVDTLNKAIGEKANASEVAVLETEVAKKVNDFSITLENSHGLGGSRLLKFATVKYANCNDNNGVRMKIDMVSGHGSGTPYPFYQEAIIRVNWLGDVDVDNFKYYGDIVTIWTGDIAVIDGSNRRFGDICYIIDKVEKQVDFYCITGQWSTVDMTPYKRLSDGGKGEVIQPTTSELYNISIEASTTTPMTWADNSLIALENEIPKTTETLTFTIEGGGTVTMQVLVGSVTQNG